MMEPSSLFMKLRIAAFVSIFLICFTWIVLLCVDVYLRWDVSDTTHRSLEVVMILIDTITVIMLPTLLALEFRVWLDAVRMLFLLMAHFGIAIGFTTWDPKLQCPEETTNDVDTCRQVNMYMLLGSWVVPILLLVYTVCLAAMVYRRRRYRDQAMPEKRFTIDGEAATPTQAELPIMPPPRDRSTVSSITHMYADGRRSQLPPWLQEPPPVPNLPLPPLPSSVPPPPAAQQSGEDEAPEKDSSPRSSARLSKRLPARFF